MIKKIGIFLSVIIVPSLFYAFGLAKYLSLESLKENSTEIKALVDQHHFAAVICYYLIYVLQTTYNLPGALILSLSGGFLFGQIFGAFLIWISALSGATLSFLCSRYLFKDTIVQLLSKSGQAAALLEMLNKNLSVHYLISLRLIPLIPFFLLNVVSSLTQVSLSVFALSTGIGILPASFIFATSGNHLSEVNTVRDIFDAKIFAMFAFLAFIPIILKYFLGETLPQAKEKSD